MYSEVLKTQVTRHICCFLKNDKVINTTEFLSKSLEFYMSMVLLHIFINTLLSEN